MPVSGVCPACSEALPSDGRLLRCTECEYAYHLGNCSGWSEGTFKSKGEAGRSSWRCINCRTVKSRGPGRQGMEPELVAGLADIVRRLDALAGVPGQINELKESIQLMSDKYDEILTGHLTPRAGHPALIVCSFVLLSRFRPPSGLDSERSDGQHRSDHAARKCLPFE
ncbi:hypothetical protein MTO96_016927 [Rhipicephalus appendiculatus]